jgi:hypothetical protein
VDQPTDHQRNLVCALAKDDEMIDVRFVYLTGQKRPVFRNARLAGSWNGWTNTPMTAVVADDGRHRPLASVGRAGCEAEGHVIPTRPGFPHGQTATETGEAPVQSLSAGKRRRTR